MENEHSYSGYGHNPNGTDMARDDYYAENPDTSDHQGDEKRYLDAEAEMQQDEILRQVVVDLKKDVARLDQLLGQIYRESNEYDNAISHQVNPRKIGSDSLSAATTVDVESLGQPKAISVEQIAKFPASDGTLHESPLDAANYDQGKK